MKHKLRIWGLLILFSTLILTVYWHVLLLPILEHYFGSAPLPADSKDHAASCQSNLYVIQDALEAYIHDHAGRLPEVPIGTSPSVYSWIKPLSPYIRRYHSNVEHYLHCLSDTDNRKPASYKMPIEIYGVMLSDLKKQPSTIIIYEDIKRHQNNSKRHQIFADSVDPERTFRK